MHTMKLDQDLCTACPVGAIEMLPDWKSRHCPPFLSEQEAKPRADQGGARLRRGRQEAKPRADQGGARSRRGCEEGRRQS